MLYQRNTQSCAVRSLKKEGNGKDVQTRPISKEAREILYKFTKVDREGNFYCLRFVRLTTTLDPMH
jgi:predicted transcriptional regulator